MNIMPFLWRSIKWRFHYSFTIIITILQPILWLILYSVIARQSMKGLGIENYTAFILPGLIILVCFSSCSSIGIVNYLTKTDGSFYRILIAPVQRSAILLGQILECILCAFFETGILLITSWLLSVKITMGIFEIFIFLFLIFLTSFFISSLAYLISLKLPNEIVYETAMNAIVLPIFFLSTALFPIDSITGIPKTVVSLNPFTHIINALRSLLLKENIEKSVYWNVIFLFLFLCAISFFAALYKLKKEAHS